MEDDHDAKASCRADRRCFGPEVLARLAAARGPPGASGRGLPPRRGVRDVTRGVTGPRLAVLCEYLTSFATEPVAERLECWELPGPRYSLSVTQFASPDGDGDEAWISEEVADVDALWRLLEEWSRARRIGAAIATEGRRALAQAFPAGRWRASQPLVAAAGDTPPADRDTLPARSRRQSA
jgi:hypothetical protein